MTPIEVAIISKKGSSKIQFLTDLDSRFSTIDDQLPDFQVIGRFKSLNLKKYITRSKHILGDFKSTPEGYYVDSYQLFELINSLQTLNTEINEIMKSQTCHLCQYSTYRKSNYEKHLRTKSHLNLLKQENPKSNEGVQYTKVIHADRSYLYACKKCNYRTTKKSAIDLHMKRKRPCDSEPNFELITGATKSIILGPSSSETSHDLQPEACKIGSARSSFTPISNDVNSIDTYDETPTYSPLSASLEHSSKITCRSINYADSGKGCSKKAHYFAQSESERPSSFLEKEREQKYNSRQCPYCGKQFSKKSNALRHISDSCRVKKQQEKEKAQILEEYLRQMEEKDLRIRELETQLSQQPTTVNNHTDNSTNHQNNIGQVGDTTVKINSDNTINIQQNNHIQLLAFGKEDLDHLNKGAYKTLINKGFASVPMMVDHVHFHDAFPQNHNIFISNLRDKYAMVFNGKGWVVTEQKEAINQLYEDKKYILEKEYEKMKDELNQFTMKRFNRFLSKDDEASEIKNVKGDIKRLLYNKKEIGMKSRKKYEQLHTQGESQKLAE